MFDFIVLLETESTDANDVLNNRQNYHEIDAKFRVIVWWRTNIWSRLIETSSGNPQS